MGARGAFKKKNKEAAFPNSGQHAENQRLVPPSGVSSAVRRFRYREFLEASWKIVGRHFT